MLNAEDALTQLVATKVGILIASLVAGIVGGTIIMLAAESKNAATTDLNSTLTE